jgi:hypothetical protein
VPLGPGSVQQWVPAAQWMWQTQIGAAFAGCAWAAAQSDPATSTRPMVFVTSLFIVHLLLVG